MKEEEKKKNTGQQQNNMNNKGKDNNNGKKKKERNDINEKLLKSNLEEDIAEVIIHYYTNSNAKTSDIKRFVSYLRYCSKDNKSNNSFTNRAYALYQYLTEQYSTFIELEKVMKIKAE